MPLITGGLQAQEPAGPVSALRFQPRVHGIALLAWSDQVPDGSSLAEFRVVQPVLGGDLMGGKHFGLIGTLNFEGITVEQGELALGDWGEGFVDRRHPHAYVHELMLTAATSPGTWQAGAALGRGFVAFGTDDPMSRPAIRYPVNHHWSQILERAVLIGQLRYRPVTLEGSLFNGDEPERPGQLPNLDRWGDSWALRLTVIPISGLEAQLSRARVKSPEHRDGAGLDHRQWNASVRIDRMIGSRPGYGLIEWARTDVGQNDFQFESLLLEGAIRLGRVRPYYMFERTERPEEERTASFRSRRPLVENSILGISRWTTHTAGLAARFSIAGWGVEPVLEATAGRITKVGAGVFEVADWYRSPTFLALSLALRLELAMSGHRMGRYAVQAGHPQGAHPR